MHSSIRQAPNERPIRTSSSMPHFHTTPRPHRFVAGGTLVSTKRYDISWVFNCNTAVIYRHATASCHGIQQLKTISENISTIENLMNQIDVGESVHMLTNSYVLKNTQSFFLSMGKHFSLSIAPLQIQADQLHTMFC